MISSLLCALAFGQNAVTVPFRVTDDAIIVDATVNGRPVSLMFDTGFSGQVVLNTAIDIGEATETMTLRDFVGEFEAPMVKLKSLKIGAKAIAIKDAMVVQQPLAHMTHAYNTHADGILGLAAMADSIVTIDFAHHEFVFEPNSYDISNRVPDGKTTFLGKMLPIGRDAIVMSVSAPGDKPMTMTLDTGNGFYATTHRDVLERIGLWPEGKKAKFAHLSGIASGPVSSWSAHLKNMTIFGVPVASSVWDVIDLPASEAESDGTVGFQFLKNFTITLDYGRRRVWMENTTGEVGSDIVGEPGFLAGYDPGKHVESIYSVAPGGPADLAGIKVGDELISVGDTDLTTQHDRQIAKMLQGPIGSKVSVAISRLGDLKRYELTRASLANETN